MPLSVLITAGSRRVPLVRAFQRALRESVVGGSVVVSDVNPLSPSVYVAERAYRAPLVTDPSYVDAIADICRAEGIRLVVPTIDDELPVHGREVERFAAEGIRIAVSPVDTTTICNDKHATYHALAPHGIAVAETYLPHELSADLTYPLFIKPRDGRGSVSAFPVRSRRELDFFLDYVPDPVVQPYLEGPEFTIDMLCDFDGRPVSIVPRERVVIRSGVVDRGRTVRNPAFTRLALACASALRFVGAVNIQCRLVDGEPVVFEINPRFSGGIPLTIAAGADFPRMLVDLALGRQVPSTIGQYRSDLWMTSHEASFFLGESAIGFSPARQARPAREVA